MTRNIFFDDPLFEEFALRPLIIDGCPLGEISATTSLIEEGDRDGWYRQWTATAERVAGYADESVHAGHRIVTTVITATTRDFPLRKAKCVVTVLVTVFLMVTVWTVTVTIPR